MTYSHLNLARAMCTTHDSNPDNLLRSALNFELPPNGEVPEWVHVLPIGPNIEGRDGRRWVMSDPQAVVNQSYTPGRDIVGDYEHASELKAPKGEKAPAAFWGKELEVRKDGIWARVEWTPEGRKHVENKEYRYLSPVFTFNKDSLEIYAITSVGLTNQHNLFLTALNQEDKPDFPSHQNQPEDDPVKLSDAIRNALKLKEDATEQDAVNAISTLNSDLTTAKNQQQNPSLNKFVPRGDYDAAMNRAETAETKLNEHLATARNQEVTALIEGAIEEGKIVPASKDFYISACNQEGGVENFKKFIESAPAVVSDSGLDSKKPGNGTSTAMNAEQQKVADQFGNSAEDIAEFGK